MAERWALRPAGYSKLLSDLKQRIQARPIACASGSCTRGRCRTHGRARLMPRWARASAGSFEQTRRSFEASAQVHPSGTFFL
jgi:hypothetical protein